MGREEYRLHRRLFAGGRFAAFPVVIAVLVAAGSLLFVETGTDPDVIVGGLGALAVIFGLHTGSIGFVGRDAIQDLLGEITLVVFAGRTLPLSNGELLGAFVLKDLAYYAMLFLFPMAVGATPAIAAIERGAGGPLAIALGVAWLWVSLLVGFALGLGTTLAGIGLARRGLWGRAALALAATLAVGGLLAGVDPRLVVPVGSIETLTPARVAGAASALAVVYATAALTFDPASGRAERSVDPAFARWNARLGDPIATKTLLSLHRSTGGIGKVGFSAAILAIVTVALIDLAGTITGRAPSIGLSVGAMLGLSGFTTYNWLAQAADPDADRAHPISIGQIVRSTATTAMVLGPAVGLAAHAIVVLWTGAEAIPALVGAVLLVGIVWYVVGVTVALAGLSPGEFLFDGVRFALFGVATMVPLGAIFVVAFVIAPLPPIGLAALVALAVALGTIGLGAVRLAVGRWTRRLRQA
ncbi:hypothetical protein HARCEL1_04085 [Halococcoides cellulosivorans]|uniref:Uncharacterized protein n=2 Tax=Halococcoides cellulosivorans TaxID=1679096 RepID=A0A2R4X4I8_9EURY|nr:hypothetical protein HARCEL1_04085 [Halococcoides cellulosivorans]